MTPVLKAELAKLTLREKLALQSEIEAEIQAAIEAMGCPPGIMSEDDPRLAAELERRWQEIQQHPERTISWEEMDLKISRRLDRSA